MGLRKLVAFALSAITPVATLAGEGHRGPVTGIAIQDETLWSCSQAGVFRSEGGGDPSLVYRPEWRVVGIAAARGTKHLVICGGEPGISGKGAWRNPTSGKWIEIALGDDLAYAVATAGGIAYFAMADGRVLEVGLDAEEFVAAKIVRRHRHSAAARDVAVSGDGGYVASVGLDRVLLLSAVAAREVVITAAGHTDRIDCVAFSPGGAQIVSGARDGKLRMHDRSGRMVRTYPTVPGEITALVWDGSGGKEWLLAGSSKGGVFKLDPAKNSLAELASLPGVVSAIASEPCGRVLIGEEDRIVRLDGGGDIGH